MSTDPELESRLTTTLRAKAAQVPDGAGTFDPGLVTLTDVGRPPRSRSPLLVAAAVVVIVVVAALGLTVVLDRSTGTSPEKLEPAGFVQPTGPAVMRLDIEARPELKFNAKDYTVAPGIVEIAFTSSGGSHDLGFADPSLAGFHLTASEPGVPSIGKVELLPNHDYTIYCSVAGHRQAGLEAVIHTTTDVSTTTLPESSTTTTRPNGATTTTVPAP